jgi:DNA-binding NarL/FixJ family response regulator
MAAASGNGHDNATIPSLGLAKRRRDPAVVPSASPLSKPVWAEIPDMNIAITKREQTVSFRILVADSDSLSQLGITSLLVERWPDATVHHASSGGEVLTLLEHEGVDAVILDSHLRHPSILSLIEKLNADFSDVRVLVMARRPLARVHGIRMLQAGAFGYWKEGDLCDLIPALERILGGHQYISPTLAEGLAKTAKIADPSKQGLTALTAREREVFQLLAIGRSLKEIAGQMKISAKTVSTFRCRLLEKMHFRDEGELVRYCWEKELPVARTPERLRADHVAK